MDQIQGKNSVAVSKTLKFCEDLELFEQDAIQHIIDYKWQTYGYDFFRLKFVLYMIFLLFYYWDLESIHLIDDEGRRIKDKYFWINKGMCTAVQLIFFMYELF